jgi:hypothetical protein
VVSSVLMKALCILAQHLGHANEGIEWSAELMAHVGEELRLVLACFRDLAALVLDIVEQPHVAPALMSSKIRCGRALLRPSPLCARGTTTQQIGWLYISNLVGPSCARSAPCSAA